MYSTHLDSPLISSLSDASGLNLKARVTELFGHMKELAPNSGSQQSLNRSTSSLESSIKSAKTSSTKPVLQRSSSVSTNKAFQINPMIVPGNENRTGISNMSTSKSYNSDLNKSSVASDRAPLTRSMSNSTNLTSLCVDISPSNSHFFEVLYIGKIKVSHKKVPETLIDDALGKFKHYEVEKLKAIQMRRNSLLSAQADSLVDQDSVDRDSSLTHSNGKKVDFAPLPLSHRKDFQNVLKEEKTHDGLMSPSLTPLDGTKRFFPNDDEVENTDKEIDDFSVLTQKLETDKISPQLSMNLNRKAFSLNLESSANMLSHIENHNLSTLTEDDSELSPTTHSEHVDSNNINKNENIVDKINFNSNEKDMYAKENDSVFTKDLKSSNEETTAIDLKHKPTKSDTNRIIEIRKASIRSFSESQESSYDKSDDEYLINNLKNRASSESRSFSRDRSASIGTLNLHKTPITQLIGDQNRTMLFQVGRSDLRLISPDRKQILLHKHLRDVASCIQGIANREHFGFICREPNMECFVGYVFKCQSESVSSDVVGAITQAFVAHADLIKQGKEKSSILTCDHCPMIWYHKLCQDLEGLSEKRIHSTVLRKIEQLVEEEQVQIMTKYHGGTEDLFEVGEQNAFLMMLLRAHCEGKQQRHIHDTVENRSEFLNQYLGGSTIFMKAKRSLSSSFDHLLKRKPSKDDFSPILKESTKKEQSPVSSASGLKDANHDVNQNSNERIGSAARDISLNLSQHGKEHECTPSPQLKSPMMDIFMKLGNSPSTKTSGIHERILNKQVEDISNEPIVENTAQLGSWRQAIFNRVIQAGTLAEEFEGSSENLVTGELLRRPPSFTNLNQARIGKRNKDELKELWKKGINQAILLIRMEKENARLRARQEVSAVKRIKLEYEDIGGCANENLKVWDMLTAPRESRISTRIDSQILFQAVRQGVPRAKRGEVWYFLAEQFCLKQPPPDTKNIPNYNTPYESLLKQLTSHQHAILIDLGRTFPNHTYFSSPMGPGQLALFNLLKAYSLLDPEVGYCQGLSFVAGVLLLHLEEAEAFLMLRHLMFRRSLRKQYLPDMIALQIQLYQLSRLLKDHIPELYEKFDQHDVSPTLYAAPWLLTIFTSQFPLGFVTRVFDLLFLESSEVIFRVAIALLEIHKEALLECDSFEEIMDYLKHKMPNIDKPMLDKVIKLTFTLDFSRQLNEYQVEYNVLQEEMGAIAIKVEALTKLENENKRLLTQNRHLTEELEANASKLSMSQIAQSRMESRVKSLEQNFAILARYIGMIHDKKRDGELPNDVRRLCQQVQQNDRKMLGALGQKLGQSFSTKFSSTDFISDLLSSNSLSEESSSDPDDKNMEHKNSHVLKNGTSNQNKVLQPKSIDPQMDQQILDKKRQYLAMKKSFSCNAGLSISAVNNDQNKSQEAGSTISKLASNLKSYPLRVLDENYEISNRRASVDSNNINIGKNTLKADTNKNTNGFVETKKTSKFFANSHEQIRQEKMQAEQLKKDFDENLRKLDARLSPHDISKNDNSKSPMSPPSMRLNHEQSDIKLNLSNQNSNGDSGIGTPISPPNDKNTSQKNFMLIQNKDDENTTNHPLVGCDIDIKFDVHTSKLKSLRPPKLTNPFANNTRLEQSDSRN